MTGAFDDQLRKRLRSGRIVVLCGALCGLTGLGWHGATHLSFSVDAASRPLEPMKDAEQDLPARHFVLAHSRTDALIEAPAGRDPAAPLVLDRALTVESGQTMIELLLKAGIDRDEANAAISAMGNVYEPRRLKAGQEIRVSFAPSLAEQSSGRLMGILVSESVEHDVQVTRAPDGGFTASEVTRPLTVGGGAPCRRHPLQSLRCRRGCGGAAAGDG